MATGAALTWWLDPALPVVGAHSWWPAVALLFALSERFAVHLPFGRDTHSLTFGQAPLVLGLFFLETRDLLLAALVGAGLVWVVLSRQPPVKLVFNAASLAAQVSVAAVVFVLALDVLGVAAGSLGPATWLAALVATLAGDLLSNVALFAVITARRGSWRPVELGRTLALAAVGTLVVTDLALVTVLVLRQEPTGLVLLGVGAVLSFLLYQGYHVQRLRSGRLELLYGFTRSVDQALRDGTVPDTVCAQARELLRARHAELVPCGAELSVDPSRWYAGATAGTVRLPRGAVGQAADELRAAGHVDGMAAPLREEGEVVGLLVVADRLDDVSTFDRDDELLLEALCGHAGVALANAGLVERVRAAARDTEHVALHDPLTGLPNRLHFQQRLERRLTRTGSAAVLLMDIDRFKEVNDTLGHDVGDRLIRQVAERLRDLEGDETVVARLGGDEFAVLLGGDDVHVEGMVARITRDVARPVEIDDITLDVSASIGIAATPRDGSSAALLLRRAEVAMYDAKGGLTGVARYSSDRDPYSSRRLGLIGDLARALDEGALDLHYQPQADPATGQVVAVEALLRWQHPVWGSVAPDEFVPLAEHTGLVRPLTRFVVETAVRQAVRWREAGLPVLVAVNISARNLTEHDLPETVARILVQSGLPAHMLTLEVTESAIVAEPERGLAALERLVDLGLAVSLDDFGTGYSSLTRLRSLPVHEVKVDREFVRHLADDRDDLAIVRAVVSLGHELGLRVVAEGVEDERAWRVLEDLGCDLVQGFHLARPMPAEAMTGWLRDRMAAFATPLVAEREARPAPGRPSAPHRGPEERRLRHL